MLSDPGRVRRHNEDACAADAQSGVFVVCDGVGGAAAGEIASRLASDTFVAEIVSRTAEDPDVQSTHGTSPENALRGAIDLVNRAVYRQARQTPSLRGMATTMVALLFEPAAAQTVWLANVGDSRCYRLRHGAFELLTQDHSVVEEQVRAGEMTREQAERSPIRNVITRAIGSEPAVQPDLQCLPVAPGDIYLLASDGLMRELGDDQIAAVLKRRIGAGGPAREAALAALCEELVRQANQHGGGDNITCLLVEVGSR